MSMILVEADFLERIIRKNERLMHENEELRMISEVGRSHDQEGERDLGYME